MSSAFKPKRRSVVRAIYPQGAGVGIEPPSSTALVVEIQAARRAGRAREAQQLADTLLRQMLPLLRQGAKRFESGRGSLSLEDLVQVGAIEVFKAVETYDGTRSRGQTFEQWTFFRANRAMKDHVGLQRADVCVPEDVRRGRRAAKGEVNLQVASSDEGQRHASDGDDFRVEKWRVVDAARRRCAERATTETAEDMLSAAQTDVALRRAISKLPAQTRDILARVYGIGREQQSVREVSRDLRVPRARIDQWLSAAVEQLRAQMRKG